MQITPISDTEGRSIVSINNGLYTEYPQLSIKEANLCFLKDAVALP